MNLCDRCHNCQWAEIIKVVAEALILFGPLSDTARYPLKGPVSLSDALADRKRLRGQNDECCPIVVCVQQLSMLSRDYCGIAAQAPRAAERRPGPWVHGVAQMRPVPGGYGPTIASISAVIAHYAEPWSLVAWRQKAARRDGQIGDKRLHALQ
jgi:hypothetical protein